MACKLCVSAIILGGWVITVVNVPSKAAMAQESRGPQQKVVKALHTTTPLSATNVRRARVSIYLCLMVSFCLFRGTKSYPDTLGVWWYALRFRGGRDHALWQGNKVMKAGTLPNLLLDAYTNVMFEVYHILADPMP